MSTSGGIAEFYRGRHVLVTGATGFMGKVLVEKLLRSCPEVGRIYLLMRPKRGRDVMSRQDDLVNDTIFEDLARLRPDFAAQLHPIAGDVTKDNMGISPTDRHMLTRSVNIVFHCAANVRFDLKLRAAMEMNTIGTKRSLELAAHMTELQAFIYVSTSYCHCDVDVLEERSYPAVYDPHELIQCLSWMDDVLLDKITPTLLGKFPNTYAFTKNLSEHLVTEYQTKFPVGIARPSIVTAAWKEPKPGWVENLNGPVGIMVGAGKGVLRSMHCKPAYYADLMPVDIAINLIIGLSWHVAITKPTTAYFMNVTVSANPLTWYEWVELGRYQIQRNPFSQCIWYPNGSIKNSLIAHKFAVVFFHYLPAYIIDFILRIIGRKPFMVMIQDRLHVGLKLMQYYTTKEWVFNTGHSRDLRDAMTVADRDIFFTEFTDIDNNLFIENYILGTRLYCLKEDPATLPEARKHMRRLYWLDQLTSRLFYMFLVYLLFVWRAPFIDLFDLTLGALVSPFNADPEIGQHAITEPIRNEAVIMN